MKIYNGSIKNENIDYNYTTLSDKPRSFKTSRINIIHHKTAGKEDSINLVLKAFKKVKNKPHETTSQITLDENELINLLAHLALKKDILERVLRLSAEMVIDNE